MLDNAFTLLGDKWGASAGLETAGGIIRWSFADLAIEAALEARYGDYPELAYSLDANTRGLTRTAFQTWDVVGNFTFQETADSTTAHIRIGQNEIDGVGGILGLTSTYDLLEDNRFDHAVVQLDVNDVALMTDGEFLSLIIHEVGHTIGLGHSSNTAAVMYGFENGRTNLAADDVAGIQALYGLVLPQTALPGTSVPGTNPPTTTPGNIVGTAGNDTLFGGAGADTVAGGAGNDFLIGEDGGDQLRGESGDDILFGRAGNDMLQGGDGLDSFFGEDGNDTLIGGAGIDNMLGGPGADIFWVGHVSGPHDGIFDFNRAEGDRVQIQTVPGSPVDNAALAAAIQINGGGSTFLYLGTHNGQDQWVILVGTPAVVATDLTFV